MQKGASAACMPSCSEPQALGCGMGGEAGRLALLTWTGTVRVCVSWLGKGIAGVAGTGPVPMFTTMSVGTM